MPAVIPNNIEVDVLTFLLSNELRLRLYSNNYIPSGATTVAALTEVFGGGYVAKPLLPVNWVLTTAGPSMASYPLQQFFFSGITGGPNTIYGYYITDIAGAILYMVEAFPGTISPFIPAFGAYVNITPNFIASGGE